MQAQARIYTLGAGQDVGRSCIVVEHSNEADEAVDNKRVMLDCGAHLVSAQRFPDFSVLPGKSLNQFIDCALISHFHLDHCGALPILLGQSFY